MANIYERMLKVESDSRYAVSVSVAQKAVVEENIASGTLSVKEWVADHEYEANDYCSYNGKPYQVIQPHKSQKQYTPDIVPSLYKRIAEEGQGDTPDNPIPYDGNMELFEGKYYSQANVVYYCFRSTGQPVYHALADLVGLYVEVYEP